MMRSIDTDRLPVASIDLYDPAFTQDPHARFKQLRERCPVAYSDAHGGFWTLTRYDDVVAAANDTASFSSKSVTIPRDLGGEAVAEHPPITLDPPRHIDFRRLLLPGFSTRKIASWEPTMQKLARDALAGFLDRGECDAAVEYARAIPVGVMCPLFGAPLEREPQFRQWAHDIYVGSDLARAETAATELHDYFVAELADRRVTPGDDMVTLLINSTIDGAPLPDEEMVGALSMLLVAGMDTVWNVLSNSLLYLATHPTDRRRLVEQPELLPSAIEEFLRVYTPASPARVSKCPVTIGATDVEADASVMLALPSANRDADVFPDPDQVDLERSPNRHIAFGSGPHRCIGAPVARLELQVALAEWLQAIPEFELQPDAVIEYSSGQVWGPRSVPVTFSRRSS
jgi:cytochrome P450